MMASSDIWVAPLVERLLNHYLNGPKSETCVEDDGSNLRFADNSPHSALIVEWTEDDRSPMPNLTDTKTQIQAILARESLEEYGRDYPDQPLSKVMRGHTINLLDFELVFEYTTSEPKLHLYVKRFSIAWDKSRFKGPPQGKIIRKKPEVYDLMRSALRKAKSRETATTDSAGNGNHSDESIKSQDGETDGMNDSQNQLMSQMPPKQPVELFATAFASAKTLLGSLKPSARLAQDSQGKKDNGPNIAASGRGHHAPVEATKEPNINRCAAHIDELSAGPLVVGPGQNGKATVKEPDQTDADTAGKVSAKIGSGKAHFNTNTQERALTDHNKEPEDVLNKEGVPSQIVQKNHLEQVEPIVKTLPTDVHTSNADPWDGMTEIRKEDITIPKDQAKLLDEQAKLCWLPPAPGQGYPQPNVPPLLLQQWNEIALQRSIRADERRTKELETLELHGSRPSSSGATSSTDSAYETPSGDRIEWSQSPPRRRDLPADSSPPEARPVERPDMDKGDGGNGPSDQPPHKVEEDRRTNVHQEISHEQEELDHLPEGARESHESIALPTELRLQASGETLPRFADGDDRIHLQEPQVEFDRMSEDSVMDTSVPRPLGVDPSQSEQELGSSDPSLPGLSTQMQVQVMETPAAHLVRFRQLTQSTGGASQESQQPGQSSSPAAKSSSQSRICNTYRSNDEAKGHTSQDMSNSTQPHGSAEPSEVNIMETQLSGGEWSFPGTTPSNSAQALNASGQREPEPSVLITASPGHAEESSNPFSSYRQAHSSMQTDDGNGTSTGFPSPTQVTPTRHPVPQLKRRLSEIDMEQTPPSKRPRMACSEDSDSVQELAFNVISRRETYINRSAEHAEAQKVYEKFRSDYPDYDGDFNHFAMLCSKLQALRAKGHFQRSFLWDDFVIMHLKEYAGYLNQIAAADVKTLEYENFFGSYVLRPSYKKRSLTAKGIEISAAQHEPSSGASVSAVPRHETNTSFTGSLVDRFSNFHTRSLGPETPASQSASTVDQLTWGTSPASPREPIRDSSARSRRMVEGPHDMEPTPTKVTRSHDRTPNSPSEAKADRLERPTPRHRDALLRGNHMVEEEEPHDTEVTPKVTRSHHVHDIPNQTTPSPARNFLEQQVITGDPSSGVNREDDETRSIPETIVNNDEVEQGSTDGTHENASVELGEDRRSTAPAADQSDAESDAVSEADSFDEDWVGWHCRRLQSTGPFWSDDPNTPFKVLARADANVRSELLRRGMARFPVDERGVIQPLVAYPPMVSLRDLLDGPAPSPVRPSDEPQG
ncbi:hypothetical protein IFM58399_01747 [Aspergillus lentulus]|uniref:uncharacterized protein n=1 Tax=Aspergillus lentulus TaxID=293939 RepID=UPI0013947CA5|nr:uncharacterized protein IFM58399_01747 [Aspergillus lentulus]GFF27623.1 hypothetical protein IFM58399_01747 [Aspergillus lentulus]